MADGTDLESSHSNIFFVAESEANEIEHGFGIVPVSWWVELKRVPDEIRCDQFID